MFDQDENEEMERNNFIPLNVGVTMFNKDNILVNYLDLYFDDFEQTAIYLDGELYNEDVDSISEVFKILKNLGFGSDYNVSWSLSSAKSGGSEFGLISISTGA